MQTDAMTRRLAGGSYERSNKEIVSAVEPFLETYASPEQIADAVLALFDAEPQCKHGAHVLLPDDAEAK